MLYVISSITIDTITCKSICKFLRLCVSETKFFQSRRGWANSTFACLAGDSRSNLTVPQFSDSPLPALCCLHEGCLKGEPAVYMLIQCTPLLVEKAGVVPDMTYAHASKTAGERTTLALKPMGRATQSLKLGQSVAPQNGPWSKEN